MFRHPFINAALASLCFGGLLGCGPGAIVTGVADLADRPDVTTRVVIVFVNEGRDPVRIELAGQVASGNASAAVPPITIPAGARAEVPVDNPRDLRVRACELPQDPERAPTTWDYALASPDDGTVCRLGTETALLRAVSTQQGSVRCELVALDGTVATATDVRSIAALELGFEPDLVTVHPGGTYFYTVEDLGVGAIELRAFRIDAATGTVELIAPADGFVPINPRIETISGDPRLLQFVVEPCGRFAYLIDTDPQNASSAIVVYELAADGSLGTPAYTARGQIADLDFRADGEVAFVIEGQFVRPGYSQSIVTFELHSERLRDDGTFERIRSDAMPCEQDVPGAIAVHPQNGLVYVAFRDDGSDFVKLGAYSLDPFGGVVRVDTQCSDVVTIVDLDFDPRGAFLYLTGTAPDPFPSGPVVERVVRYPIDPVTGAFGQVDTAQQLGTQLGALARTDDPARGRLDPLRELLWVQIGEQLVPHARAASGELTAVPGDLAIPLRDPQTSTPSTAASEVLLLEGLQRGRVTIERP